MRRNDLLGSSDESDVDRERVTGSEVATESENLVDLVLALEATFTGSARIGRDRRERREDMGRRIEGEMQWAKGWLESKCLEGEPRTIE